MVLKYSIAFDIDQKHDRSPPPGTAELWSWTAEQLHTTLAVSDRLPPLEQMHALADIGEQVLQGADGLDLRWAQMPGQDDHPSWAVTIEHPGEDERLIWGVDVSARWVGTRPRIGVRLRLEALDHLRQPAPKVAKRPKIIRELMHSFWLSSDELQLRKSFAPPSAVGRLGKLLTSPDRHRPVLLVGPGGAERQPNGRHGVKAHLSRLAKLVSGSAALVALPDDSARRQFNEGVDKSLQLPDPDQMAIYWPLEPKTRQDEIASAVRELHAIPSPEEARTSSRDLERHLNQCLLLEDPGRVATVNGLKGAQRTAADAERQRQRARSAQLRQDFNELMGQHEDLLIAYEAGQKKGEELKEQLNVLEREHRGLKRAHQQLQSQRDDEAQPDFDWDSWNLSSMRDAMVIAQASPVLDGRLVFSDRAKDAQKSPFKDPARALAAIHFLAGPFLDHVRAGVTQDLVSFSQQYGYEVAMIETGVTRNTEKWMRERDVKVEGRHFRCEPHLKLKVGRAKDSPELRLSIHFEIDGSGEYARIILGHVGRHLTTKTSSAW